MSRTLEEHLFAPGKKRVLAIDGGGARGILACGILKRIETLLASRLPQAQRRDFRLHHYFDLIGGTSTGSILAAGLSIGLSVDDLRKLYLSLCPKIFVPSAAGHRIPKFKANILADELGRVLREIDGAPQPLHLGGGDVAGDPIKLGSPALRTGFAVFAKRINTGGAWALTNNPKWRYYDDAAQRAYCERMGLNYFPSPDNKDFALAQLVQASAAAPTFFASVGIRADVLEDGSKGVTVKPVSNVTPPEGVFVDGAVSGRNTPALQMLHMARHPAFGFEWKTTEDDLMMVSVGTGWWRPKVTEEILGLNSLFKIFPEAGRAVLILQTLIHDSQLSALQTLQSMSRYPAQKEKRWTIDGEVDELLVDGGAPFLLPSEPLLRFRRLDLRLEDKHLQNLLGHSLEQEAKALGLIPKADGGTRNRLKEMSAAWQQEPLTMRMRELAEYDQNALNLLYELGSRYAEHSVDDEDFPASFDPKLDIDGADTVGVIEEAQKKKKGWLG